MHFTQTALVSLAQHDRDIRIYFFFFLIGGTLYDALHGGKQLEQVRFTILRFLV